MAKSMLPDVSVISVGSKRKIAKPKYTIAKYDRARDCRCECECQLPVSVIVAVNSKVKSVKDLLKLKREIPDITILSD